MTDDNQRTKRTGGQNSDEPTRAVLDEVGPYADADLPYMNFACPDCERSICEWTDCPECGWYDEAVWEQTMAAYQDCRECGQTVAGAVCDDCDTVTVEMEGGA